MAVIQIGTLLAALVYFMPDLIHIAAALVGRNAAVFAKDETPGSQGDWGRLGWLLIAGSIPIGIAGLIFRAPIESKLTKNRWVIVSALLGVAMLLAVAELVGSQTREASHLGVMDAVAVGISQVFALVPGTSRSGITIAAGLLRGLTRQEAARFSFLLMLPAVGASGLFKLPGALRSLNVGRTQVASGVLAAGVTGYLMIAIMLGYLRSHTLYPFVVYRVALAALVSWLLLCTSRPDSS